MPKRKDLTNEEKLSLVRRYKEWDGSKNQRDAAAELGISRGMLQNLLKNEAEIGKQVALGRSSVKRKRMGKDLYVEVALLDWFEFSKQQKVPTNGPLLRQKAEELAKYAGHSEFKATEGWFYRWKQRNGLSLSVLKGESSNSDDAGAGKKFDVENRSTMELENIKSNKKEETESPPPSADEIRQALKVVERGLTHIEFEEKEAFDRLHSSIVKHLRKKPSARQTTIDSFFKRLNH